MAVAQDFWCNYEEEGEKKRHKVEVIVASIDEGKNHTCPVHGYYLNGLASFANCQPDPLWSGKKFPGLFNEKEEDFYYSKTKLQEAMKANTKMWNEPGLDKDAERFAKYKKEAQRKKIQTKLKKMVNDLHTGEVHS
jgi:hypothetical protein